jgi:hypothetical protein
MFMTKKWRLGFTLELGHKKRETKVKEDRKRVR